jgi:hypothetical protein
MTSSIAASPRWPRLLAGLLAMSLATAAARADVWLGPGDAHARSAAQYLADQPGAAGLSTEWPMWVPSSDPSEIDSSFAAGLRDWLSTREQRAPYRLTLRGGSDAPLVRAFEDEPRGRGEFGMRARYGGDRCGALVDLRIAVSDPGDGQRLRPDGTVVGCRLGNWRISAGWEPRWWGPGWNGSLIVGTNARPAPGLSITRNETTPSSLPVLRWFGEWRATVFLTRLETDRRDVSRPLLIGARLSFRPHRTVEIGLSRTGQLCGRGRRCGLKTFADWFIAHDNPNFSSDPPGNQMAGYDLRLVSPSPRVPVAAYAQMIGEDERHSLPSKFLGVLGAESWRPLRNGALLRAAVEYANTTCGWARQDLFDCTYRQGTFNVEGYRYRGRLIGHGYDSDASVWSAKLLYTRPAGVSFGVTLHRGTLNRGGAEPDPSNTVSPVRASYRAARVEASGRFGSMQWSAGVGYERVKPRLGNDRDDLRVFAGLSRDFAL